jgi:hypothetical protein
VALYPGLQGATGAYYPRFGYGNAPAVSGERSGGRKPGYRREEQKKHEGLETGGALLKEIWMNKKSPPQSGGDFFL